MDFEQAILDDRDRLREIVADASCGFDTTTYDDLWVALFDLHEVDPTNLLGSTTLTRLYDAAKLIHAAAMEQVRKDAALDEDAAIETGNEIRAQQQEARREEWAARRDAA